VDSCVGDIAALTGDNTTTTTLASTSDFTIAIDPTSTATILGTTTHFTVTVSSIDHFAGDVQLEAINLPASWTAAFMPPSISLTADATQTADLAITIPTNGDSGTQTPGARGTAMSIVHDASTTLDVANEILIPFTENGIGTGPHSFPSSVTIRVGTTVRFYNYDTTGHEVHSDGGPGFAHQSSPMGQGQEYDVAPTATGTYPWSCHLHGLAAGSSELIVQP